MSVVIFKAVILEWLEPTYSKESCHWLKDYFQTPLVKLALERQRKNQLVIWWAHQRRTERCRREESSSSVCCVYLITGRCSKRSKAAFVAYASQAHEGNF